MSERSIQANQANARKSTGPRTAAGKLAIARNGLKHGILSQTLLLDDESPRDFGALLADLEAALRPVGVLEAVLVEKVAGALWRQRRLARAETAHIEQNRRPRAMAFAVGQRIGRDALAPPLTSADLEPSDPATLARCRAALAEAAALDAAARSDWRAWETVAPLLWRELLKDASNSGASSTEYLEKEFGGNPADYLSLVVDWCQEQIDRAGQSAEIQAAVRSVRDERAIPVADTAETLGRYANALDRELYRAIKALREAQRWRLETFEALPAEPETP